MIHHQQRYHNATGEPRLVFWYIRLVPSNARVKQHYRRQRFRPCILQRYFTTFCIVTNRAGGHFTARRRISDHEAREIAMKRMVKLLIMAEEEARANRMERGRRYVELATKIGMRTNTPMPKGFMYCRSCLSPLVPGRNCRVRLRSDRVVTHCLECDGIRRTPYLREKKEKIGCTANREQS
jgi:ribonuclease P protein subunit RPR2